MPGPKPPPDEEVLGVYERAVALARGSGLEFVFPEDLAGDEQVLLEGPRGKEQTAAQKAILCIWPAVEVAKRKAQEAEAQRNNVRLPPSFDGGRREAALSEVNQARLCVLNAQKLLAERARLAAEALEGSDPPFEEDDLPDIGAVKLCAAQLGHLETLLTETHVRPAEVSRRQWEKAVSDLCICLEDPFSAKDIAEVVYNRRDESALEALGSRIHRRRKELAAQAPDKVN